MDEVFANHSDEDETYPLITEEIAKAQWADVSLKHLFKHNAVIDQGLEIKLIENTTCVCKDGRLVIPKPAVSLLLNLEAAQQGRSMLFSDEQKLPFEGGKKGSAKNTKLDFMRC
jgi:hypothetical protein